MAPLRTRTLVVLASVMLILAVGAACTEDGGDDATQPPPTETLTSTDTPGADTPSATTTPAAGAPTAPSNVTVSGNIPDLGEPVPPGEGETGRISVDWRDESDDEDGFRIYTEECEQPLAIVAETPADESTHGPLNPCRPARVGIAAFNAEGESEIVWAE